MIKSIIIDDEERSRIVLQYLLTTYCPEIEVVATADSVKTGVSVIQKNEADLIFLDIQLTDGTGFDILERIGDINASIIFTTAYDKYAVKAFKFSAVDYLLKPINIDELKAALKKISVLEEHFFRKHKIQHLLSNLKRPPSEAPVLLISSLKSVEFVRIIEIIRCEANGAYSTLYLKDGTSHMVSRVIKELEFLLKEYSFFRVHQSHLINLKEVRQFLKPDNCLVMRDGTKIQLAKSRKDNFFSALNKIKL